MQKQSSSILKRSLCDKSIRCIPLLFHDIKLIIDFQEKAEFFNSSLSKQCSIIDNESKLTFSFLYHTNKKLSDIAFKKQGRYC